MITRECLTCKKTFTPRKSQITKGTGKYCSRECSFKRPKKPIPHGTPGAYTNHHCRCEVCTKVWSMYARTFIQRSRAKEVPKKCVFPNCSRQVTFPQSSRGFCHGHYKNLLNIVKSGKTTWQEIKDVILK